MSSIVTLAKNMKTIRNAVFETNSSSSHSLTINSHGVLNQTIPLDFKGNVVINAKDGEYEFGWQNDEYYDVNSKLNYAYIQATDVGRQDWLDMLNEVIKEHTGANNVYWNFEEYSKYSYKNERIGYIDHQSSSIEGENTEIFDNKDNLKWFLFDSKSYIKTGNDNDY